MRWIVGRTRGESGGSMPTDKRQDKHGGVEIVGPVGSGVAATLLVVTAFSDLGGERVT